MKIRRAFFSFLPFLALIFLFGCATLPQPSPEEDLRKRVDALMQARVEGKWDQVYDFYDPAFRKSHTRESFLSRPRNMLFKAYRVETVEMLPSENEATVSVKTDISVQGFDFKNAPEKQHWVKEDGNWFIKVNPQQMLLPSTGGIMQQR